MGANDTMRNINHRSRRGIASLEFVLGVPFLIALGGVIVMAGFVGVAKLDTVVKSRHQAWEARTNPSSTASMPLLIYAPSDAGMVVGEKTNEVKTYDWLGGKQKAKSRSALITGTWDHRQIPEMSRSEGPHIDVLTHGLIKDPRLKKAIGALSVLVFSGGILSNKSMRDIENARNKTNDANDDANDKVDDANKNIDREIEKRREEIKTLEFQIKQLEAKREQKEKELEAARANASAEQNRLEKLEAEAAAYANKNPPEPVPQSLLDKIKESRRKRDAFIEQAKKLEGEIDEINRDIAGKKRQIQILEEEIRDLNRTRPSR